MDAYLEEYKRIYREATIINGHTIYPLNNLLEFQRKIKPYTVQQVLLYGLQQMLLDVCKELMTTSYGRTIICTLSGSISKDCGSNNELCDSQIL